MSLLRKIPTILGAGGNVPEWRRHLQPCEYLETDGHCYINLGIPISTSNYWKIKIKKFSNMNGGVFGSSSGFRNKTISIHVIDDFRTRISAILSGNKNELFINADKNELVIVFNNNVCEVYDFANNLISQKHFTQSFTTEYDAFLFALNNNNNISYWKKGNVFTFEYENQLSLIAAYVIDEYTDNKGNLCSAGVPGMVDILTGVFYTNDGPGQFTHGEDIDL